MSALYERWMKAGVKAETLLLLDAIKTTSPALHALGSVLLLAFSDPIDFTDGKKLSDEVGTPPTPPDAGIW